MKALEFRAVPRTLLSFLLPLLLIALSAGCGGTSPPDCSVAVGLAVAPPTATADHLAAAPGNRITFVGANIPPNSCPPTPGPIRFDLKWSVSDAANVTIGNTQNVDYGTATCVNAAPAPVTVTASATNTHGATITGTSMLTCK
jgi:hypothetical protein